MKIKIFIIIALGMLFVNDYGFSQVALTSAAFPVGGSVNTYAILSLSKTLTLTCFVQGFYDAVTNAMINDTMTVYLRNNSSPYEIVDSSKTVLNSSGSGTFTFLNTENGVPYYLQLKHRNSIEMWSAAEQTFTGDLLTYDFSTATEQAFGNNLLQVDNAPLRFAIFNGDVNQDGVVDGTDAALIDNDAFNFESGYIPSDLNGDEVIDGSDGAIADNNAANFVGKITP